jgi:hypothetical protein
LEENLSKSKEYLIFIHEKGRLQPSFPSNSKQGVATSPTFLLYKIPSILGQGRGPNLFIE